MKSGRVADKMIWFEETLKGVGEWIANNHIRREMKMTSNGRTVRYTYLV